MIRVVPFRKVLVNLYLESTADLGVGGELEEEACEGCSSSITRNDEHGAKDTGTHVHSPSSHDDQVSISVEVDCVLLNWLLNRIIIG